MKGFHSPKPSAIPSDDGQMFETKKEEFPPEATLFILSLICVGKQYIPTVNLNLLFPLGLSWESPQCSLKLQGGLLVNYGDICIFSFSLDS